MLPSPTWPKAYGLRSAKRLRSLGSTRSMNSALFDTGTAMSCFTLVNCASGAEKQLLEIVAGVVLAQSAQAVPNASIGQHDLEAEHLFARGAVAQHIDAAGVGRQIAADLAAALRGKREGKEASRLVGRALH